MQEKAEINNILNTYKESDPGFDKAEWLKNLNPNEKILNAAFISASRAGRLELVALLACRLTSSPMVNFFGAILAAIYSDHFNVVEFLTTFPRKQTKDNINVLHWALGPDILKPEQLNKLVKLLITSKVDLAADDNYAIRLAAGNGFLDVVKLLLEFPEVDPRVSNDYAIRTSSKLGHLDVTNYLASLPCYNPFSPNVRPEEKEKRIKLLKETGMRGVLSKHYTQQSPNSLFLLFKDPDSQFNLLNEDTKTVLVNASLDIECKFT
jgi:hypothetical protein